MDCYTCRPCPRQITDVVKVFVLIIYALQFPDKSNGAVEVSLRLVSFSNYGNRMANGECCDTICRPCDYEFGLCFSRKASALYTRHGERHCDYGRRSTGELDKYTDSFYFPFAFKNGQPNPINIAVPDWEGGIRVSIQVNDIDMWLWDANDMVFEYTFELNNQRPSLRAEDCDWTNYILSRGNSRLKIQHKMYCLRDYYGRNCRVYCKPRNDWDSRYTCDQTTGAKICHPGYHGYNCGIRMYCQPRDDRYGHYFCDPLTGEKICYPGYHGFYCHLKVPPRTPAATTQYTTPSPSTAGGPSTDVVHTGSSTPTVVPQTTTSSASKTTSSGASSLSTDKSLTPNATTSVMTSPTLRSTDEMDSSPSKTTLSDMSTVLKTSSTSRTMLSDGLSPTLDTTMATDVTTSLAANETESDMTTRVDLLDLRTVTTSSYMITTISGETDLPASSASKATVSGKSSTASDRTVATTSLGPFPKISDDATLSPDMTTTSEKNTISADLSTLSSDTTNVTSSLTSETTIIDVSSPLSDTTVATFSLASTKPLSDKSTLALATTDRIASSTSRITTSSILDTTETITPSIGTSRTLTRAISEGSRSETSTRNLGLSTNSTVEDATTSEMSILSTGTKKTPLNLGSTERTKTTPTKTPPRETNDGSSKEPAGKPLTINPISKLYLITTAETTTPDPSALPSSSSPISTSYSTSDKNDTVSLTLGTSTYGSMPSHTHSSTSSVTSNLNGTSPNSDRYLTTSALPQKIVTTSDPGTPLQSSTTTSPHATSPALSYETTAFMVTVLPASTSSGKSSVTSAKDVASFPLESSHKTCWIQDQSPQEEEFQCHCAVLPPELPELFVWFSVDELA